MLLINTFALGPPFRSDPLRLWRNKTVFIVLYCISPISYIIDNSTIHSIRCAPCFVAGFVLDGVYVYEQYVILPDLI